MIYIWRCDLDSNHDPRGDNLEARHLDATDLHLKTHVTGIYPKMNGSKISFVLLIAPSDGG